MSTEPTDPYAPPTASVKRVRPSGRKRYEFVGFLPRLFAMILDSIIFGVVYIALFFALGTTLLDMQDPEAISPLMGWFFQIAPVAVVIGFWMIKGATPGKMFMGIKIVNLETGENASFFRCLWRYICYTISAMPLGLGYFWVLWGKDQRAWHDLLSGTAVIRVK